jgi:thiamine-phosphate pyrophosphorylase
MQHKIDKNYISIYALCDIGLLNRYNLSISQYLEYISKYKIVYIQYRDKINPIDIQKENLKFLKKNTSKPIIINDKIELLNEVDGLHLGQDDIKSLAKKFMFSNNKLIIDFIRKKYPNKILGISTHNELEILKANKLDLNYIGLGAYRNSNTKNVKNILGDKISYLAKISKHDVVAIGGVKPNDKIPNITYNAIGRMLLENSSNE